MARVQASEAAAAVLTSELSLTREELVRTAAVASRAAAADAKLVKSEGTVPTGGEAVASCWWAQGLRYAGSGTPKLIGLCCTPLLLKVGTAASRVHTPKTAKEPMPGARFFTACFKAILQHHNKLLCFAGCRACHAGQHLEEVRFLNGTICRLKDKLAAAEKEAAVAHTLKVSWCSVWLSHA